MEYTKVSDLDFEISRITLGTWAIGGWQWGGTDEQQSVDTVLEALEMGVSTIDTAPIYGFGKSEELVGRAVKEFGNREEVQIATKFGLQWDDDENVRRNSSRERILKEFNDSLRRLQTDYIDIYQIHWPDLQTNFRETANTLLQLLDSGKIKAIGVSNFSVEQMEEFQQYAPIHVAQPPYNLFERGIEHDLLPYCNEHNISLLTYGALCRGLLSGKMDEDQEFQKGDLRRNTDPKFQGDVFKNHLDAVEKLKEYAAEELDRSVLGLAVRWILHKGVDSAIWGARRPEQVTFDEATGWELTADQVKEIETIVEEMVEDPVSPAFMAPPE
ncbi:aldo/keto reductase [Fodinibius halophilus]|uniref:Aldo/keto reductase n=1 Tax=Fodinibius halophilus TaxID=1736908 RepID=A0A6M1T8S5_9BACT|nr:aldo/keto reductase [Fodinibius halophilus]NGP88973.1 aldo/keto reductase [Fodinibius halophilus]